MKLNDCAKESSVLTALANDSITDELTAHLNSCTVCQEAKLVSSYLRDAASADVQGDILPAGIIWWRAQVARKRVAARRSIALIDTMQKIAVAVGAIIVLALAAWQAPKLFEMSRMLLAGSVSVLILFLASVVVVLTSDRDSHRRALPRGM